MKLSVAAASVGSCARSTHWRCSEDSPLLDGRSCFSQCRPPHFQTASSWFSKARSSARADKQQKYATQCVRAIVSARDRKSRLDTREITPPISSDSPCSTVPVATPNNAVDALRPTFPCNTEKSAEPAMQELTVYEVNELDRWSPMLLSLSKLAIDWPSRFRMQLLGNLGDMVAFTNKIFDGSLTRRLGITAGMITLIRHYEHEDGLLFEAVYSFYFGDYGHLSVKGPYKSHADTVLTVTGGSGVFTGVYGTVQITNVDYPFVLFYRFQLYGIEALPHALQWETLPPAKGLRPARTASLPSFALPNFTD